MGGPALTAIPAAAVQVHLMMVGYPNRYGLGGECRWRAKPPRCTASPGSRPWGLDGASQSPAHTVAVIMG